MKHLLLTTIAAVVLVGCASLHLNTNAEPNLELTKEGLLVDLESQAPYSGKQSAKLDSGEKHWEGSLKDGKRHGQYTLWDMRGSKRSLIRYKDGQPHGEWIQWNLKGEMELLLEFNDGKLIRLIYPGLTGKLAENSNRRGWIEEAYKFEDRRWLRYKPSQYPFRYFQRVMSNLSLLKAAEQHGPVFDAPPYID